MTSLRAVPSAPLDPAPRSYATAVTLRRRSARGAAAAPDRTTLEEIEAWLLADAMAEDDLLALFESLCWRFVAAGFPFDRASLHVGTLHPQAIGFAWNWDRADGLTDELRVDAATLQSDAYKRNPLARVIERGEEFRADLRDPETLARYPLMAELASQGMTDYVLMPLRAGGAYHNAASGATKQAGGFTAAQMDRVRALFSLFALHAERHIVLRIAGNVLDTYLGAAAGGRVLKGAITRGAGEPIRAVIWSSDLRGFTDLSERLGGPAMIALLNAYFERLAGAVIAHDGEILKFIGDGLLAVFPYSAFASEQHAAEAALAAAEAAQAALARLNEDAPPELAGIEGWRPLRTGIALHEGEVFFGNVGAPERLDFTVIGGAVNAASRVETLTKTLGRPILITEAVARLLSRPLERMGAHTLRGVAAPIEVFSPAGAKR